MIAAMWPRALWSHLGRGVQKREGIEYVCTKVSSLQRRDVAVRNRPEGGWSLRPLRVPHLSLLHVQRAVHAQGRQDHQLNPTTTPQRSSGATVGGPTC
jgi:hypothetical protein